VRHMDMLTHNHASPGGNTPPWAVMARSAMGLGNNETPCGPSCTLSPYNPNGCPPGADGVQLMPHHMLPKHLFVDGDSGAPHDSAWKKYDADKAPCVCVTGRNQHLLQHGQIHARFDGEEYASHVEKGSWSYDEALTHSIESVIAVLEPTCCGEGANSNERKRLEACLRAAIDEFHLGPLERHKEAHRQAPLRCDAPPKGKDTKGQRLLKEAQARRLEKMRGQNSIGTESV
jgi:GHH signature containing HNH/Endo VII superfamily nuclease toxin  2